MIDAKRISFASSIFQFKYFSPNRISIQKASKIAKGISLHGVELVLGIILKVRHDLVRKLFRQHLIVI